MVCYMIWTEFKHVTVHHFIQDATSFETESDEP